MKYLYTKSEIRHAIHNIFSTEEEKWAIVGYVGYRALDQLPTNIENLNVVCWPKAGATHPEGVRRLIRKGINVYFCEDLHSKIYWAKGAGLIVGSTNLSENALGQSRQHEFAVFLPDDGEFQFHKVLDSLNAKIVDEESLHRLDLAHAAAKQIDPDSDSDSQESLPSFLKACEAPLRRKWKFITWREEWDDFNHIQKAVYDYTGDYNWTNGNDIASGSFEPGDFVFQVQVDDNDYITKANGQWLRVDMIATPPKKTPLIVQISSISKGVSPPFKIDGKFKNIFMSLYNETSTWDQIIDDKSIVKKDFIEELLKAYRKG